MFHDTPHDRIVVGRRPPDLWSQDHHRPSRGGVPQQPPHGRHQRLPAHGRKPLRRLRRRPLSVSISAAFGIRLPRGAAGEEAQGGGRDRRFVDDGRPRVRGLNNAGASQQTDLLVILNDNDMAIDKATGACAAGLPVPHIDLGTLHRFQAAAGGVLSHTPPPAAAVPEGPGREHGLR